MGEDCCFLHIRLENLLPGLRNSYPPPPPCFTFYSISTFTVMIQSFQTDRVGQTVQTQIRLLLEEQSDQGLHFCYSICIVLTKYPKVWPVCLNFRQITENFSSIRKFTVHLFLFLGNSSSIPPGEIAGVVIGCIIALIIIVAVAVFVYKRQPRYGENSCQNVAKVSLVYM